MLRHGNNIGKIEISMHEPLFENKSTSGGASNLIASTYHDKEKSSEAKQANNGTDEPPYLHEYHPNGRTVVRTPRLDLICVVQHGAVADDEFYKCPKIHAPHQR